MGQIYFNGIISSGEDSEVNKKQIEYMNYIDKHRANVMKAFAELFASIKDNDAEAIGIDKAELKAAIRKLSKQIINHDTSKYEDEEFYGYRLKYYPTEKEKISRQSDSDIDKEVRDMYDKAWEHHYKNNWHHPEAWIWLDENNGKYTLREVPRSEAIPMPLVYILEMICDWYAMSMVFEKLSVFYASDKSKTEREFLNPDTKITVDKLVEWIKNYKE